MLENLYVFMIDELMEADDCFRKNIADKIDSMKDTFLEGYTLIILPETDTPLKKMISEKVKSISKDHLPYLLAYNSKQYNLKTFRRIAKVYNCILDETKPESYELRLITCIKNEESEAFRLTQELKSEAVEIISLI